VRRRIAKAAGVAALAVAAAVLVAVVVLAPRDPDSGAVSPVPPDPAAPIETRVDLSPRTVHFGDTVTARVDVTLDRARVRPGSVTVVTGFDPWEPLGKPRETRVDGESTTHLRTTWRLRCVQSVCLPPDTGFTVPFEPVTVTYRPTGDDPGDPIVTSWPQLKVNSRLADDSAPPAAGSGSSPFETPWRADLVTMPAASFRFDPDKLQVPLFAAAGVLALVGLGLAWAARPRRRPKPVEVEEAPPPVQLSPLEHALMLLEDGAAVNGAADRRRALELLAGALAGQGDDELARRARELAWSSHEPGVERTTPIAEEARPRLLIEEEDEADADAEPEEAQQEEEDRSHA
jgi:hypothetical protein